MSIFSHVSWIWAETLKNIRGEATRFLSSVIVLNSEIHFLEVALTGLFGIRPATLSDKKKNKHQTATETEAMEKKTNADGRRTVYQETNSMKVVDETQSL